MKEIGGYFELELNDGEEYHKKAIKLNTGRNCLEYILNVRQYNKIYIPYFTCDVILEPIQKLGLAYEFYSIDEKLNPIFAKEVKDTEAFLYTNYFGIKTNYTRRFAKKNINLIIDNSQAFFDSAIKGIDTFYSPRKFFGVPDGGYLYTDNKIEWTIEQDSSWERLNHLVLRIDTSATEGYNYFTKNDSLLINQPIKRMSKLTLALLKNIDYEKASNKRNKNFINLHDKLYNKNELQIDLLELNTPMIYPFLCSKGEELKKELIKHRVYVPTYWRNNEIINPKNSFEDYLTNNLIPLPIDQRYGLKDMNRIFNLVENFRSKY